MSFEEILTILRDGTKTDWQKAADLHAALASEPAPTATIKPIVRRKRGPNKPKDAKQSEADTTIFQLANGQQS